MCLKKPTGGRDGDIDKLVLTSAAIAATRRKTLNRTTRVLPRSLEPFDQNVTLLIAGSMAAIFDYQTETAFVIEHARIASLIEALFTVGWDARKESSGHLA